MCRYPVWLSFPSIVGFHTLHMQMSIQQRSEDPSLDLQRSPSCMDFCVVPLLQFFIPQILGALASLNSPGLYLGFPTLCCNLESAYRQCAGVPTVLMSFLSRIAILRCFPMSESSCFIYFNPFFSLQ